MIEQIIYELKLHGLEDSEQIVSKRVGVSCKFEAMVTRWSTLINNILKFDQYSMYTVDEYENDLDVRLLLAEVQFLLTSEGRDISNRILGPLDETFFKETIRLEKSIKRTIPEKYWIFYYHIPKRYNAFFMDHLRRLGIL